MIEPWHPMTYDADSNCWMVHLESGRYPMHCGEFLEIRDGERGIPCRLELDRDWYVIMQEVRFYLRKKDTYQIHV